MQVLKLPRHDLHLLRRQNSQGSFFEQLGGKQQRCNGRPQFVGRHADELGLEPVQLAEVGHVLQHRNGS